MNINKRFKANEPCSRLDHFLTHRLPHMSRSSIARLIKENRVKLNDAILTQKSHEIEVGDVVDVELPDTQEPAYTPSFQFKRLYEDEHLLVIDKPSGLSVHVGAGIRQETILDAFLHFYPQVKEINDDQRPGIVHRLDRDTSGILLLAKDVRAMKRLQKQFKRREVEKTYLALVTGEMRFRAGTFDAPIVRSPRNRTRFVVTNWESNLAENAKEAITDYEVIRAFDGFSFVKLSPHTGRTHQLRVHLSHAGNPILGDTTYGKGQKNFERLALHAYSIQFMHPITKQQLQVFSPFPKIFRDHMKENFQ